MGFNNQIRVEKNGKYYGNTDKNTPANIAAGAEELFKQDFAFFCDHNVS
jgi:hypothetical protein